ncbi:MAG: hypothetical protein A3C53_01005 [Omnitrophica WOR_2 bacterium RIFCSPHIGHO2_02_FULL_68_15]|nr:MAG: hypothetical protein A3C53_01005 [Omnitrophica WOR_2 bacterium RIFCSPHIGHO2_02_FULL_68_15]
MSPSLKDRLVEALTALRLVSPEDLAKALATQKAQGGGLSDILVGMGLVEAKALVAVLSQELQIPPINLTKIQLDHALTTALPRRMAVYYQLVPVSLLGGTLAVAMADPLNILALDEVTAATGLALTPLIATKGQVQAAIQELYGDTVAQAVQALTAQDAASGVEIIEMARAPARQAEELIRLTQETPVVRVTDALLQQGVAVRASDILIEPFERRLRIRYRVDGLLQEADSPPLAMHEGIVSRLKVMASLDIAEHRLPQDGRFQLQFGGQSVDFRLAIVPSSFGEKVVLRVLDRRQATLDLARLGFDPATIEMLLTAARRPHGMLLVTGPTGAGKSTTLYALLKAVDSPTHNVVTVEDPVEYAMAGINQVAVNADIGLTFAACLRAILRQDPDVILVGEIRDSETADIAIKAALTGHLVLSTLHTNDAIGAVARLMNMGVEPFLISASLVLVGAQRLLRKVCTACKATVPLPKHLAHPFGLDPGNVIRVAQGKGCPACKGSGYHGRLGIMEVLHLDGAVRAMITAGAKEQEIRAHARTVGMRMLRELAIQRMLDGVTTPEEALRVTVGA